MPGTKKRWSNKFDHCKNCGKKDQDHQAHGFCTRCYSKVLWKADPEYRKRHTALVTRWRKENPERSKEIVYAAVKRYQAKHRLNKKPLNKKPYDKKPNTTPRVLGCKSVKIRIRERANPTVRILS